MPAQLENATQAAAAAAPLVEQYDAVRRQTERLCQPLVTEDYVVQSMPDVSPTKWHLAHTSWFFETFLLTPNVPGYRPFDPQFAYLFNSYYVTVGDRHCRQNRGLLSRPTVEQVWEYRKHVDQHMREWLTGLEQNGPLSRSHDLLGIIELGLHHEQQHQELMVTDIKHVFWVNPLRPAYRERTAGTARQQRSTDSVRPTLWAAFPEGVRAIGHAGEAFAFDNESPRHRVFLESFELSSRLVTNAEYKRFIGAGGYTQPNLWLSAGWATVNQEQWAAPLYWIKQDGQWWHHTLAGLRPVEDDEPVCHVSYYEADAYARWVGARLPTEAEWEVVAAELPVEGNFVESEHFHPAPAGDEDVPRSSPRQMFGDVWEWTRSQYSPYPGYQPAAGALGEYNGKFMCNQFVLRGGSCATPRSHIRPTYRNFFPPEARWQFTGIRLARYA